MRPGIVVLMGSAAALALGGCGLFQRPEDQPAQEVKTKESAGRPPVTVGELDQMARNYSDRLVARISTACDQIKKEPKDEEARVQAHQLKLSVALAAYDIVSTQAGSPQIPGAAQHILDLTILTELHAIRWIEEHAARDAFTPRGEERLVEALGKAREDIWDLAGRIMKPEQMDQFRTLILQWRQKNAQVEWLSRVRLDVIASGSAGAEFTKAIGQGFSPNTSPLRVVDETRILAQQALFYMKRAPTLVDWTTESTVSHTLAVPKISTLIQSLTTTLGSLAHATATLEQLAAPSSQEPAINSTIGEVRETVVQAKDLVREVRALETAIEPFLQKSKDKPAGKPVDIEAVASKVDNVAKEATTLVRETRNFAESPVAVRNLDDVLGRVGQDINRSGRQIIDHATWRAVELVILIAVLVVVYKVVASLIRRRRAKKAESAPASA